MASEPLITQAPNSSDATQYAPEPSGLSEAQLTAMCAWVEQQSASNRIGIMFEHCFEAYLNTQQCTLKPGFEDKRFQPIHSRVQVNLGRQKRTCGEFDFLFYDQQYQRWRHSEIAVKYYLGLGEDLQEMSAWVGPNKLDRLDLKYRKLFDQQLSLSAHANAINTLSRYDIDPTTVTRHFYVKGMLFLPWRQTSARLPLCVNPNCERGYWFEFDELENVQRQTGVAQWLLLERSEWMCLNDDLNGRQKNDYRAKAVTTEKLTPLVEQLLTKYQRPVQLIAQHIDKNKPLTRYIVTPLGWSETTAPPLTQ
ncbi:hypothetical protein GCM10025791_02250 [Halioxenophilus aromaticivorans]|uniref:Uncharacterized protein n=1 Tax=Halioxenophilus aromaticivorans TaxID=1306992 RepID=A0AAV3TWW8_9ALTE